MGACQVNAPVNGITLRRATSRDARAILECHHSAVHEIACNDYPPPTLNEWSPPVTTERVNLYSPRDTTVVAEIASGTIVGFGELITSNNELRALYVSAYAGGLGVGSAILQELEHIARAAGCPSLTFNSSITAEPFYLRHGYSVVSRGEHTLSSGGTMACVRLTKQL
jgi:putative acetyltransferase